MITKVEARRLVHKLTVDSLRKNKAGKLFKGNYRDNDIKKLDKEMEALADFLEKRGKINDESSETDVSGEGRVIEAEVSPVRESET